MNIENSKFYKLIGTEYYGAKILRVFKLPEETFVRLEFNCRTCGELTSCSNGNIKKIKGCRLCRRNRIARHGLSEIPEYGVWEGMKQRCHNPKSRRYLDYGGRGIRVAPEWLGRGGFARFFEYVGPRPAGEGEGYSLDRINNDGNYEPGNVRWAPTEVQMRNTRRNRALTINGVTKLIVEWSNESGVVASTITQRLAAGWAPERAVFTETLLKGGRTWRRTNHHRPESERVHAIAVRLTPFELTVMRRVALKNGTSEAGLFRLLIKREDERWAALEQEKAAE